MATELAKRIIDEEIEDPELAEVLNDIREYKQTTTGHFTKPVLDELADEGFPFTTFGVVSRRSELKTFINKHPSVMSSDETTLMDKIMYCVSKMGAIERKQQKKKTDDLIKKMRQNRKKRVIVEEYTSEEDSDVEYVPPKQQGSLTNE